MVILIGSPETRTIPEAPPRVNEDLNSRVELKREYDLAVARYEEGKKLLTHYRAKGPYTGKGEVGGEKSQKLFDIPQKWAGRGTYKWLSDAQMNEIVINTGEYLDAWFPAASVAPARVEFKVQFQQELIAGVAYVDKFAAVQYVQVPYTNLLPTSAGYWKAKVQGKHRRDRCAIISPTLVALKASIDRLSTRLGELGVEVPNSAGDTAKDEGTPYNYGSRPLAYNVGMVNEAYFGPSTNFQELVNMRAGGNKPGAVTSAEQLWQDSKGNKGMIWLYTDGADDTLTIEPESNKPLESTRKRYAFQFHYNPSTVDMAWGGSPDVDVTLESSGNEKFNMLGGQTMASISFELVINRIFDMQYYGTDGLLKPGRREERNPYSPRKPDNNEQKRIYNYGTMYDIEYLLATILGYKLNTRFRAETSDIGFLNGRPVDLHLGHRLRYWGYISDVAVSHVMFDERMVPIFSTLRATFNRIPDYPKA